MDRTARMLWIIVAGLALLGALVIWKGVTWEDLRHFPTPRNAIQDGETTVQVPLPVGEPVRLLPPVETAEFGLYEFTYADDAGNPVRYDPCRAIRYVLNPEGMPTRAEPLIHDAVAKISAATGLQFAFEGYTEEVASFDRPLVQEDMYGKRWAPLIVGWSTEAVEPELAGTVTGIGGSSSVVEAYGDQAFLAAGVVLMDTDDVRTLLSTSADSAVAEAVIMHELGHVVGLAHVDNPLELMNATNEGVTDLAVGDLRGLSILGAGPCEE